MRARQRRWSEVGTSSLAFVIALPVLVFGLGATAQYFIKADAQRTAQAAAEEGAAAARRFDGSAEAGRVRAYDFLHSVDNASLENVDVSADRGAVEASVTVTGEADNLGWLPFLDRTVTETSTGPVERYVD